MTPPKKRDGGLFAGEVAEDIRGVPHAPHGARPGMVDGSYGKFRERQTTAVRHPQKHYRHGDRRGGVFCGDNLQ
eukprot:517182-Lingulodinium_polyedra.AAC.1